MSEISNNVMTPGFIIKNDASDSEKLQRLIDREAIAQMVSCYAYSLDKKDWEMHRALFEDDLEMDFSVSIGPVTI